MAGPISRTFTCKQPVSANSIDSLPSATLRWRSYLDHPAGTLAPKTHDDASFKCEAILRVEPRNVPLGGILLIECGVRCTSGFSNVYNGCLSERLRLPAQIVI